MPWLQKFLCELTLTVSLAFYFHFSRNTRSQNVFIPEYMMLRHDGPLGSYADFTYLYLALLPMFGFYYSNGIQHASIAHGCLHYNMLNTSSFTLFEVPELSPLWQRSNDLGICYSNSHPQMSSQHYGCSFFQLTEWNSHFQWLHLWLLWLSTLKVK